MLYPGRDVNLAGNTSEPEDNAETVSVCDVLNTGIPPKAGEKSIFSLIIARCPTDHTQIGRSPVWITPIETLL
jgi:hypothetical protein